MIRLYWNHRGTRYEMSPVDPIEVWVGERRAGDVPVSLLMELLSFHLRGAQMDMELRASLAESPPLLTPQEQAVRLARAKARRARGNHDQLALLAGLAFIVITAIVNAAPVVANDVLDLVPPVRSVEC